MSEVPSYRGFIAPGHYVQGPGVIDQLGELLQSRVDAVAVLVDELLIDAIGARLSRSLAGAGIACVIVANGGEVTQDHIDSQAAACRAVDSALVVAVGGGKTLDTGKGVARALGVRVVTVPTIASNDGPTSRVIAMYDDHHRMVGTPTIADNPLLVVVDTELIARAPSRFLLSGVGDAIAKRFEAAACARGTGVTSNGGRPLVLPGVIADCAYRVLIDDAEAAVRAVERGEVCDELERVVEAAVLMSGLAFENGGLSLAHSMTRGLMVMPGAAGALHGYHVAYGLLVQLEHEGAAEAAEVRGLFERLGLPTVLRDFGAEPDAAGIAGLVDAVLGSPHLANCVPSVSRESLTAAIAAVEP